MQLAKATGLMSLAYLGPDGTVVVPSANSAMRGSGLRGGSHLLQNLAYLDDGIVHRPMSGLRGSSHAFGAKPSTWSPVALPEVQLQQLEVLGGGVDSWTPEWLPQTEL